MSDGFAEFDAMIDRLRKYGETALVDAAKESAPLVQDAARATAAAGTDPYGEPWRLRRDGQRAIPEAAAAVDAIARGPVVVIRVHRGAAIQNYLGEAHRRQVIPSAGKPLPGGIVAALQEGAARAFRKAVR